MYILCSVIETIALKTTCFAVSQTLRLGWSCSSYLLSQIFSKSKRERNRKLIYLEDIVIQDIKMMDTRSKYIDYNDSDSDDEYSVCEEGTIVVENKKTTPPHIEMKHPISYIPITYTPPTYIPPTYESTSAFTMHDNLSIHNNSEEENLMNKQVQIIKEIINDEKYLKNDIKNEMKKKEELEEYLKNEYDKRVKEEIDNEWVNIQVYE
jgi:hypothetical protein